MKKLKLKHVMKACKYQLFSSNEIIWACFPDGQNMTFHHEEDQLVDCVFSRKTSEVYILNVYDDKLKMYFRWTHPDVVVQYKWESVFRRYVEPIAENITKEHIIEIIKKLFRTGKMYEKT